METVKLLRHFKRDYTTTAELKQAKIAYRLFATAYKGREMLLAKDSCRELLVDDFIRLMFLDQDCKAKVIKKDKKTGEMSILEYAE